jgi:GNAT superfamily N-acetyltransferase
MLPTHAEVCCRLAAPSDIERVDAYFRSLSPDSRYNRFLGAMSRLPSSVLEHVVRPAQATQFTVLATASSADAEIVIGEARYVVEPGSPDAEFAVSVGDDWRRVGVGRRLLQAVENYARCAGTPALYGETLRTNQRLCALAAASGFEPGSGSEWHLIRFRKALFEASADSEREPAVSEIAFQRTLLVARKS